MRLPKCWVNENPQLNIKRKTKTKTKKPWPGVILTPVIPATQG
jgi:hypothetical protein